MNLYPCIKKFFMFFLILFLGISTLYPNLTEENSNYYLGVLASGYPDSLVVGEFKYANVQIVNMKGNMVLFGIDENTKLTTFLKNLPFLEKVYVDARDITDIKGDDSFKKNPLVREFLFLVQKSRNPKLSPSQSKGSTASDIAQFKGKVKHSPDTSMTPTKGSKQSASRGNMALIDQLIREKAKKIRAKQGVEK